MERRVNYVFTLNDCYKVYCKNVEKKDRLSLAKFKEVYNTYIYDYVGRCFDMGQKARLPYSLANLFVIKFKGTAKDYEASKRENRTVYFDNDRTGGYLYQIKVSTTKKYYRWAYVGKKSAVIRKLIHKRIIDFVNMGKYYPAYLIEE